MKCISEMNFNRPRPSHLAFGALTAGVLAYEAFCDEDELISRQFDRWLEHENKLVRGATYLSVGATALHLLNVFDNTIPQADPYRYAMKLLRRNNTIDKVITELE